MPEHSSTCDFFFWHAMPWTEQDMLHKLGKRRFKLDPAPAFTKNNVGRLYRLQQQLIGKFSPSCLTNKARADNFLLRLIIVNLLLSAVCVRLCYILPFSFVFFYFVNAEERNRKAHAENGNMPVSFPAAPVQPPAPSIPQMRRLALLLSCRMLWCDRIQSMVKWIALLIFADRRDPGICTSKASKVYLRLLLQQVVRRGPLLAHAVCRFTRYCCNLYLV